MAKSKRHKHASKDRSVFYEAVPMFIAPPAALPSDVSESLAESRAALAGFWRQTFRLDAKRRAQLRAALRSGAQNIATGARVLAKMTTAQLSRGGFEVTERLMVTGHTLNLATHYATDAVIRYTPPLADDARSVIGAAWRTISGRRARLLYLALGATGTITAITIGVAIATTTLNSYANDISSPAALMAKKKTGTTILDQHGKVLFEGYGAQAEDPIKLSDLPQALKDATLAAEDPDFYAHPGFSWRGTVRAAWVDLTHMGRVEGGSTLTQQLVKNTLLTSDKKFERKYQELLLAMQLEQRYTKDQILEMYLNEIYYGQGSAGVEAASQTYFHKSAQALTLGESALIAGLPLGPSRFDPNVDVEAATGRRDFVLARMLEHGKITKTQADAAKATPIQLASAIDPNSDPSQTPTMTVYAKNISIKAPWFVFYVLNQLRNQYGEDIVEQGGITVRTTLDLDKQELAQQTVADQISRLSEHHVTNGGLISLEPKTGNILAMVGSVDYNAPGFGNVNVTLSQLQPGSSFKPIAYATAFKKGWTGATIIDDSPLSVPNGDGTMYTPMNYDLRFHGKVTARHALDNSLNIPAVKTLQFAGIHDTIQTAHDLGITTLQDESRFGLALVLGGGEVRPIDMATVYGTFANGGLRVEPRAILSVADRHGKDITKETNRTPVRALDERYAYMITNILSDDGSRQPEFPANGPLHLSRPAAAKTGTTNDFRDNWTVGYTPQIVTAVWVGNNDHSAMNNVDGITGAAPIWHDYMEGALAKLPVQDFNRPAGVTIAKACSADGGLANPWDTGTFDEVFLSDALPGPCKSSPRVFQFTIGDNNDDNPNEKPEGRTNDPNGPQNPDLTPLPTPIVRPRDNPTPNFPF